MSSSSETKCDLFVSYRRADNKDEVTEGRQAGPLMLRGIYSVASAMDAGMRNQEVVAQNLAHATVSGYRVRGFPRHGRLIRYTIRMAAKYEVTPVPISLRTSLALRERGALPGLSLANDDESSSGTCSGAAMEALR